VDSPPPELRPGGAFLLVVVCLLAALVVALVGSGFSAEDEVNIPWNVAALLVGPLAGLYVGLSRYAPTQSTGQALRLGRTTRREVGLIAVAIVLGGALALVATPIEMLLVPPPSPEAIAREQEQLALVVATVLLLKPFIDELFYRSFLVVRLARTAGRWPSILIVAGAYALAQATPATIIPISPLLLGLGLGVAALAAETVWVPAAGHIAFECARFGAQFLPAWTATPGAVAAAGLVWWLSKKWDRSSAARP
jgi:membrane protease YdiL (CAAX protease family)